MAKKIMLSGVKPTGRPHIGNYFGAMKQFVDLSLAGDHDCFVMIADYHALNFIQNAEEMKQNITDVLLDYLAIGLNPDKVTIFKQSDVSEHTELAWIFDTITTVPYLMRSHAYKDIIEKGTQRMSMSFSEGAIKAGFKSEPSSEASMGTLNYPVLMAADILLYDTDMVPVGKDQKQHVEYAREIAQKFNYIFGHGKIYDVPGLPSMQLTVPERGDIFKLPEEKILNDVAIIPGTDGRKMSKSYSNTIPLFAEPEEIRKAVMSIVTDSSAGVPENVFNIHKLFRPEEEIRKIYEEKKGNYKELKEMLIADIEKVIGPMRERRRAWEKELPKALEILERGGKRAKKIASKKMEEVRKKIGVNL